MCDLIIYNSVVPVRNIMEHLRNLKKEKYFFVENQFLRIFANIQQ